MQHIERYWEAVRRKVCEKCVDGDGSGNCRLTPGQECALRNHFPEVLQAVHSVKSNEVQPYVDALRLDVCSVCIQQGIGDACALRAQLDCGLDRYFPLVIEAIEEVNGGLNSDPDAFGD